MKYKRLKIVYLIMVLVVLTACKPMEKQNTIPRYVNDVKNDRLNGPVSKHFWRMSLGNEKLLDRKEEWKYYNAMNVSHGNLALGGEFEYDSFGRLTASYRLDSLGSFNLDSTSVFRYYYDEQDFNKKKNLTQPDYAKNTFNPLRILLYRESSLSRLKKLAENHYDYQFDKKGNILSEENYELWDDNKDSIFDDKMDMYVSQYNYDNKGKLIERKFDITTKFDSPVSIDHYYEALNYFKINERYTYDESGRLATVKMERGGRVWFSEEYTYDSEGKVTHLWRIKYHDISVVNDEYRISQEHFFNEYGDPVKIITYDIKGEDFFGTPHATYHFTYSDHDQYGNWLRCEAYLNRDIDGNPDAVFERIIEYYPVSNE